MSLNLLLNGQLRYLSQFYDVTAISGPGEDMEEMRRRESVKIKEITMERGISPFKDLKALFQLYSYFKQEKPDIVHSITPKAGLLSMTAARWAGVPVRMHTFTGLIFPSKVGVLKRLLIVMDRILTQNATHVFPEGRGVRDDLIKYRITRKPLKIIANGNVNGINTAYFTTEAIPMSIQVDLKQQLGISDNAFVFIFVGRLVADKGLNELVGAFKNLQSCRFSRNSDSIIPRFGTLDSVPKLLLVGPLEQHHNPVSNETLKEIENNPHIISAGYQIDVRPYYAVSHALAFPSHREGFPNVVLQAGAMGLPSIVTDINGCNEIIQDEINGLIIPVKNTKTLLQSMLRLLEDGALYDELRLAARQEIVAKYEQITVWEALVKEYRDA